MPLTRHPHAEQLYLSSANEKDLLMIMAITNKGKARPHLLSDNLQTSHPTTRFKNCPDPKILTCLPRPLPHPNLIRQSNLSPTKFVQAPPQLAAMHLQKLAKESTKKIEKEKEKGCLSREPLRPKSDGGRRGMMEVN